MAKKEKENKKLSTSKRKRKMGEKKQARNSS